MPLSVPEQIVVPEKIFFGGLEGASGEYCLPPRDPESMRELLRGFRPRGIPRILKAGLDPLALDQAGWCVVWPEDVQSGVREALNPLLSRRREQAGDLFKELEYFREELLFEFLERYDAGPDSVDPRQVPYYVLIVGGPGSVPFDLQVELAVSRAVGRIAFESAEGYADYAERLVAYEQQGRRPGSHNLTFFGVENQDDPLTRLAVETFLGPLGTKVARRRPEWSIKSLLSAEATKEGLRQLLTAERKPSVMFTASHAVRFRPDSPRQSTHQGSLVCADWPGPQQWQGQGAMIDSHLFAGIDLPAGADLSGLVALLFACYSAGTPQFDAYATADPGPLADAPFVSPLPRALLRRGALAVIGHVDLAFEHSFLWYRTARGARGFSTQLEVFDSILYEVTGGTPIGFAMRHLGQRHAQLAVHVAGAVHRALQRGDHDRIRDFHLWTAYVDARNYVLLGDPAARLDVASGESAFQ